MCIALLDTRKIAVGRITLISNRDEFYSRPTRSIHYWEESPQVMGGKDLQEGGTWLGVNATTRFGVITNYRDPSLHQEGKKSRGWIIRDFLTGHASTAEYLENLGATATEYNPYNLIIGDVHGVFYFSSLRAEIVTVEPGIHVLSNHHLNTDWPKTRRLKVLYSEVSQGVAPLPRAYFDILHDRVVPPDAELPLTGVDLEWERILSPVFIASEQYGTRSSSVVSITLDHVSLAERSFGPRGAYYGEVKLSEFPIFSRRAR